MKEYIENETIGLKPFAISTKEAIAVDFPSRSLKLGFVDLKQGTRPKQNVKYDLKSAGDHSLEELAVPETVYKRLNLDLYAFYIDDLPDFTKRNEGLLKIAASTKNPQDLNAVDTDATVATNFKGKDGSYAPTFLYKGVFRNILFEKWINLKFDLYELDTDADQYFGKVKQVINGVPEIKNLDVLKGIPYLNLATSLFESIVNTFGKNPDDHIWGEIPILEINPTIGGAFLRSGIYILFEELNSKKESISFSHLEYLNERVQLKSSAKKKKLPNHLIFGVQINPHHASGNSNTNTIS